MSRGQQGGITCSKVVVQAGEALVTHYLDTPFTRSSVIYETYVRLSWDNAHPKYPEPETLL